jgi:ABC-type oligopeptide transport system substrate-binding subunit
VLEYVDRIEAVDKHTVKFTLKEPNAWFLDLLASTSTWIVAKECVEKFGDLKKVESVVGTGPWMLERWEPNVKLVYVRNPNYFVPGLPYADGVDMLIDKDPSSRLATGSGRPTSASTSTPCAGSMRRWPGSGSPACRPPSTPG